MVKQSKMPDIDFYRLLGIAPDSSAEAIKKAYRVKAIAFHPDRADSGMGNYAEAISIQLNEAYEWLSDTDMRDRYDAMYTVRNHSKFKQSALDYFREEFNDVIPDTSRASRLARVAIANAGGLELIANHTGASEDTSSRPYISSELLKSRYATPVQTTGLLIDKIA